MPLIALVLGLFSRIKWLIFVAICEAILLVVALVTLIKLVDSGRYPGATGMEGIALIVAPVMYVASVAVSFAIYGIVVWITQRRKRF